MLNSGLGRKSRRKCGWKDHVSQRASLTVKEFYPISFHYRILHQPSPTTFASIHLTMECNFDMDALLSYIISEKIVNKGKTTSYVRKTIEPRPFHQLTFLFVFKYYTLVDEGFEPSPWQRHGCKTSDRESTDAVDISECSSIVGLSLERQSFTHVVQDDGQEHFAPFHILNIRCFPDKFRSEHDFDGHVCYSGPYAFLHCLKTEYENATARFQKLNASIAQLALPSVRERQFHYPPTSLSLLLGLMKLIQRRLNIDRLHI